MFFEKPNSILMQFSRNTEGYFLEKEAKRYDDIDEKILIDLKKINKEAKIAVLKEKECLINKDFSKSKMYKNRIIELMDKKNKALEKIISEYNIKAIGYHIKESSIGINIYPLYNINGYSYHIKSNIDFVEKNNLKFLGRLENECNYKTLGKSDNKLQNVINNIDEFLKMQK